MVAYWTNKGKADLLDGGTSGKVFRFLLVTAAPASAGAAADLNVVSDITANEVAVTNYVRRTLANVTITEDDTNDWAKFAADNPAVYSALGAGATIKGAWVYRRLGGGDVDGTDRLWCFLGCTDLITNGGDATFSFGANGISTAA